MFYYVPIDRLEHNIKHACKKFNSVNRLIKTCMHLRTKSETRNTFVRKDILL